MTAVVASAPGKMVLLGEYAVLEGARALVLAVDHRAQVRIRSRADSVCAISAPDLEVIDVRAAIGPSGSLLWQCNEKAAEKLKLVDNIWRGLAREGLAPLAGQGFDLQLDTAHFFETIGGQRVKLGLGSSAALAVALAGALASFAGHSMATASQDWLQRVLMMHNQWQDGRGSGLDIATSMTGGLIAFQPGPTPSVQSLPWPMSGVHCLFVWSGHAVSTSNSLAHLAQWRVGHESAYVTHMRELGELSERAIAALGKDDAATFVELVAVYSSVLDRFGAACGLEIFSPAQRRVARMAKDVGVSFKPCGAGGDFGVLVSNDRERLLQVERRMMQGGLNTVPLQCDPLGFTCDMH